MYPERSPIGFRSLFETRRGQVKKIETFSKFPITISYLNQMEWLIDLIGPGHTELASTLVLYSFVIAAGIFLGKLKIGGISLGVT